MLEHGRAPGGGGQQPQLLSGALAHRYGALTFGNVQKSIPASFGAKAPATVRKIAVRRTAQVGLRCAPWHWEMGGQWQPWHGWGGEGGTQRCLHGRDPSPTALQQWNEESGWALMPWGA